MSRPNAAGLIVKGSANPNWKGGLIDKVCAVCDAPYKVKRPQAKSRFCSLQCVGISQRKDVREWKMSNLICAECSGSFSVPTAWAHRTQCCSIKCRQKRHGKRFSGKSNPNWTGGLSRLPYPYDFSRKTSKEIQIRDGFKCHGIECRGKDKRLTVHHIDYDKQNCEASNLITLCSSCNSRANFNRPRWQELYSNLMSSVQQAGGK